MIVIDGAVTASAQGGNLLHISRPSLAISSRDISSIVAGEATASRPGADAHYRTTTSGHTELLLLTIAQVD